MTTVDSAPVLSAKRLEAVLREHRARGETVVWTNGCFDIIHAGHVRSLRQAKALGDVLVVGMNGDASVRALKGPERPVCPQRCRTTVLAALRPVDYVVVFRGRSPVSLLKRLRPDVFAKGGDYTLDTVDAKERRAVEAGGGRVVILDRVPGMSTTDILDRLRRPE